MESVKNTSIGWTQRDLTSRRVDTARSEEHWMTEEEEEEEEMMIVAEPTANVKEPGSRWSLSSSSPTSGFGAEIQDTLVGFYFCFGGREGGYRERYWTVHSD